MQEPFVKNVPKPDIEVYYILFSNFPSPLCNLSWADLPAFFPVESSYYSQDTTENLQPCTERGTWLHLD